MRIRSRRVHVRKLHVAVQFCASHTIQCRNSLVCANHVYVCVKRGWEKSAHYKNRRVEQTSKRETRLRIVIYIDH